MNRNRMIDIALFVAGVLLAIALFSAGVIWRSRSIHHARGCDGKSGCLEATLIPAVVDDVRRSGAKRKARVRGLQDSDSPKCGQGYIFSNSALPLSEAPLSELTGIAWVQSVLTVADKSAFQRMAA